jgi:hypothetical protein
MKEKILAFLKTKLTGVPNAILEGVSGQLATTITEESQIETVCNAGVIASLQVSSQYAQQEGDRRATTATQTAIKTYEEAHKLKDGKPVVAAEPATPPAAGTPEATAKMVQDAIQAALAPIQQELSGYKQKEQSTALRGSAIEAIKEKYKDSKIPIPEDFFELLTIEKPEDVEAQVTKLSERIDKHQQSLIDAGFGIAEKPLFNPKAGSTSLSVEEWKEEMEGKPVAAGEQPVGVAKLNL